MIDNNSLIEKMMQKNFNRCCELTQAMFSLKHALYKSLFPTLSDEEIWSKITEEILKRNHNHEKPTINS
ncbi:MAG TPA: hypothetical protein PK348_04290 [Spirochaetota bacterium]|nr:hypothetical protein [Spirochaetota bacterium]